MNKQNLIELSYGLLQEFSYILWHSNNVFIWFFEKDIWNIIKVTILGIMLWQYIGIIIFANYWITLVKKPDNTSIGISCILICLMILTCSLFLIYN